MHLPFCEMRCGFCNLFTTAHPEPDLVARYLAALDREADAVAEAITPARCARLAIGGGTPTWLDPEPLARLLALAHRTFGLRPGEVPTSAETSPATATPERLAVLAASGVTRVSIGVQSMVEAEVHAAGRPQRGADVTAALDALRAQGFPVLNVDLMYGLAGQTEASWLASIDAVLEWAPEEVFCYPLYVRPLTGLGRRGAAWDDQRLALYRAGRDRLLENGYRQSSMRRFHRPLITSTTGDAAPEYACQDDGMVGIGCGARSYTRDLHYSREYAVGRRGVNAIIADYARADRAHFSAAHHGIRLGPAEQRRRYVLQSLLHTDGLDAAGYRARFGSDPLADTPQLGTLVEAGLAARSGLTLQLTASGLERSDAIGPWLYSPRIVRLSGEHPWH